MDVDKLTAQNNAHKPITVHIAAMLDSLDEAPLRAVYMVVKQLYEMQMSLKKE